MKKSFTKFLDDSKSERLLLALAAGRGDRGFTEQEAATLLEWAEFTLFSATMINMALKGLIVLDPKSGDPTAPDMTYATAATVLPTDQLAAYRAMFNPEYAPGNGPASPGDAEDSTG